MKHVKLVLIIIMTATTALGSTAQDIKQNPLVKEWKTPHGTPPFSEIKEEHFLPAAEYLINQSRTNVDLIALSAQPATFENTIEALEYSSLGLDRALGVFYNLNASETNDTLQQIALEMSPMLTKFSNDISLNEALFARVKQVYDMRESLGLTTEESRLLEKTYKGFVRSGANLSEDCKAQYREISEELSRLSLEFQQNLLKATNDYAMLITDEASLAGLPESVREAAEHDAEQAEKEGYLFTLHMPSYLPFVKYSENRELREKLWRAYSSRCFSGGDTDNQSNVKRITELRLALTRLLGYNTYADFVLEERMAQSVGKVDSFLDELLAKSKSYADDEVAVIQKYADSLGLGDKVMPWDWAYYTEKYKEEKYNLNDQMTRPYFKLENVEKAVFLLANKLYGLTFKENKDIPVYHPDVHPFEVYDIDGSFLAVLYIDYFPRSGKNGGAWMSTYRDSYHKDGGETRPIVTLVCNFTKPTPTRPSLLTFDEVTTTLHEFGHGLHSILGKGKYPSMTGTAVYRDFVELPSQIMENWATEKEYLDLWAVHYQTGEAMPQELVQKIIDSKNYLAAYANIRQLSFGMTDMAWHSITAPVEGPVADFERRAMAATAVLPIVDGTCFSPSFSHIFSGGYAAGYYSYKWAELLEADAFSKFMKAGIFDRGVAGSFRENILSKGGSEHPMILYIRFAGAEPTVEPLIEKMGLGK